MLKFALTSDTHYGHNKNTHRVHEKFLEKLAADIAAQDIKVLIHAGDWTSNKQDQFYRTLKMFRKYIDIPILGVRGNHDLWQYSPRDEQKLSLTELDKKHNEWFTESNIHHLQNGPFVIDDVVIVGFDGWYYSHNPPTNDETMMCKFEGADRATVHLTREAYLKLDTLLQMDLSQYRKAVMVTHHPPFTESYVYMQHCANPNYFEPIKEKFDVFCTGHSHHYWNETQDDCLVLNCGSDYNEPKHLVFEI